MRSNSRLHGTVVTDASWCPETKVSAYAILIHRDEGEPVLKSGLFQHQFQNSQFAEEWAISFGIAEARRLGFNEIIVRSDCLVAVNKFKKKTAGNSIKVTYKHVKAHGMGIDIYSSMNRWCDRESRRIMRAARNEDTVANVKATRNRTMPRSKKNRVWRPGVKTLNQWLR